MTRSGLSRRTRFFLLWTARLALVAYLVQLVAIDHWHTHIADVTGIEGTSSHVEHCHGAGDCSSSGGATALASNAPATTLTLPGQTTLRFDHAASLTPEAAFISPPSEPPRAA
jgi:hypothetical protein